MVDKRRALNTIIDFAFSSELAPGLASEYNNHNSIRIEGFAFAFLYLDCMLLYIVILEALLRGPSIQPLQRQKQRKTIEHECKNKQKEIVIGKSEELFAVDNKNNSKMTNQERLETITYLRECFYGPEATTGRLQRFYKFFKRQ
jgi:hypothetical protein